MMPGTPEFPSSLPHPVVGAQPPQPLPDSVHKLSPPSLNAAPPNDESLPDPEVAAKPAALEPEALSRVAKHLQRAMVETTVSREPGSEQPQPVVDEKLARYVPPQKLRDNVDNFPEFRRPLTEPETAAVERIKDHLLKIPLVHSVRDPDTCDVIQREGLRPQADLPDAAGHTRALDRSLGLDKYSFMDWGDITPGKGYGQNHVLIDPRVLLRPGTVVTQFDIAGPANRFSLDHPFEEIPDYFKGQVQKLYFDQMLTGEDWLDLTARRVLRHAQTDPTEPYKLWPLDFGEVKHLGTVDSSYVQGAIKTTDPHSDSGLSGSQQFYDRMAALGLAIPQPGMQVSPSDQALPQRTAAQPIPDQTRSVWARLIDGA